MQLLKMSLINIMEGGQGCNETTISIWGGAIIPEGLDLYTDGYMMSIQMILHDGVYMGERSGVCFGVQEDTQGHFCYYATAGDDDFLL